MARSRRGWREIAGRFFDERWIDAPVRPGKAPGAFAHPTVPSAHPYVMLNYQGKPRDVMTLAHELGHGVHQVLAAPNGPLMAPTPLTLAETASVFGEMLTFKRLLAATKDKVQRKAMLAAKVEDMINTVVRQIAFYTFERMIHTERKNGELTAERIGEIWMEVQRESLGPAIDIKPGYEVFWTYIPHFIHSPFYVYAYAFGDCLVNSLYAVYEKAEAGFAERYLAMLAAGGTKHHSELLKPFGLDARDPNFWQGGLWVIERMIGEMEALDRGKYRMRRSAIECVGSTAQLDARAPAGNSDYPEIEIIADGVAAAKPARPSSICMPMTRRPAGRRTTMHFYAPLIEGIRAKCDAIVYPTLPITGSGYAGELRSAKERYAHLEKLARDGFAEWAVIDPGSAVFTRFDESRAGRRASPIAIPTSHFYRRHADRRAIRSASELRDLRSRLHAARRGESRTVARACRCRFIASCSPTNLASAFRRNRLTSTRICNCLPSAMPARPGWSRASASISVR